MMTGRTGRQAKGGDRVLRSLLLLSDSTKAVWAVLLRHADKWGEGRVTTQEIHGESAIPILPATRRRALTDLREVGAVGFKAIRTVDPDKLEFILFPPTRQGPRRLLTERIVQAAAQDLADLDAGLRADGLLPEETVAHMLNRRIAELDAGFRAIGLPQEIIAELRRRSAKKLPPREKAKKAKGGERQ